MVKQNNQQRKNNQETQGNVEVLDQVYTKKDVIKGGIIGWGLGVATTILFAPKSGKELRGDISYQVGSAKDKTVNKSRELSYTAMDKYAEIKENTTNKTKELKDKINIGKNKQSDGENSDEGDTENNSQLHSSEMENAMGNKQEEPNEKEEQDQEQASASTEKKPSANSGSAAAKKRTNAG